MTTLQTATDVRNVGGATMTRKPSTERTVDHLEVDLSFGDLFFTRYHHPAAEATVAEVLAAMQNDASFLDPLAERGRLMGVRGRRRIVLARFVTGFKDGWLDPCNIDGVTIHHDDETTEKVTVD